MATETLYATSLTSGSVSTSANALGAPDGTFTTDTGATNWTARFAMGDPTGNQANGTHTATVRVRKIAGQSGIPNLDSVALYDGATLIVTRTLGTSIGSTTGVDVQATFTEAEVRTVASLANLEVEVATTAAGGSPGARTPVQLDAVTWSGDFTAGATNFNGAATPSVSVSSSAAGGLGVAAGATPTTSVSSSAAGGVAAFVGTSHTATVTVTATGSVSSGQVDLTTGAARSETVTTTAGGSVGLRAGAIL